MLAASSWLASHGLSHPTGQRWFIEIALDVRDTPAPDLYDDREDTRFHLDIYSEEWGFFFCHAARASWIRVTDIPFVHGRDDHGLLAITPTLGAIGGLVRRLERAHGIRFRRDLALVRSNVARAETSVRAWLANQ